jgi:hypothetical protein
MSQVNLLFTPCLFAFFFFYFIPLQHFVYQHPSHSKDPSPTAARNQAGPERNTKIA